MRAAIITAAAAALTACAGSATGPDAVPEGGLRITRVADPSIACMVVTASELSLGELRGGRTATRGERATVSWRNVSTPAGTRKTVQCEADLSARRITSVKADGVELLEQPQPF